jgi:uncharacterized small protein (DUF1192 family)
VQPFIDTRRAPVNAVSMEPDDPLAKRPDDPVSLLVRQDLDPLSVTELEARISALESEIARCRAKIDKAVNHRLTAEALFRK